MAHPVLNEDWSEYDNRKVRDQRDRSKVSCEEPWEVNYIEEKMKKHFPNKTSAEIRAAVQSCCKSIPAPRPREKFIECVTEKLK